MLIKVFTNIIEHNGTMLNLCAM